MAALLTLLILLTLTLLTLTLTKPVGYVPLQLRGDALLQSCSPSTAELDSPS